jgi:S1-C subfamily serine protease
MLYPCGRAAHAPGTDALLNLTIRPEGGGYEAFTFFAEIIFFKSIGSGFEESYKPGVMMINHKEKAKRARWQMPVVLALLNLIVLPGIQVTTRAQTAVKSPVKPPCTQSIPMIFKQDSPAVVYISATSINPYKALDRVEHIIGSGFIIDAEGLVLTNSHVAFDKQVLVVRLDDGTTLPAHLLGADPIFDIAVLQIPKPEKGKLPVLKLGDSDQVRVGQEMLALGNPLGLDQSLTRGIVSAINRVIPATFFPCRNR